MSLETICLKPVWSEATLPQADKLTENKIVLFDSDRGILSAPEETVLVKFSSKYRKLDDKNYEINPANKADFEKLIVELDPKYFVFNALSGDNLEAELKSGVYPLLYLAQALQKREARVLVTSLNGKKDQSSFWGLSGAIKTCMIEASKHHFSLLAMKELKEPWQVILEELANTEKTEVEVKQEGNSRQVRAFQEVKAEGDIDFKFKEGGVYLITGGLGGLGEIFAKNLAKSNAKLILTGRRKLDKGLKEKIAQIEKEGAEVLYVPCDVAKEKEVKALIQEAKRKFKHIDGVIHSAGVNQDNFLIKKVPEDLDVVLPVKTQGVANLYEAIKGEQPEFFVLFSSTAGLIGNIGQYDYAYANAFMDHFAESHEGVSSINWPLWRHGGMQVDAESEKLMMTTAGAAPMENEDGITALKLLLSEKGSRLGVMFGEREKLLRHVKLSESIQKQTDIKQEIVMGVTDIDKEEFKQAVTKKVAELLKVEANELDLEGELDAYGLDLVAATNLMNFVHEKFKIKILPNDFLEFSTLNEFIERSMNGKVQTAGEEGKKEEPKKVMSPELYHLLHEVSQDDWDDEIDKMSDEMADRLIEELKADIFPEEAGTNR